MRRTLLATVATLALAGSAMAFGNDQPSSGQYPRPQAGITTLTCYPSNDRRSDDVQYTIVTLDLDGYDRASSINAVHYLYDGRVRDRGTQYSNDGVQTKNGFYEWYWGGHLFSNPQLTMTGKLGFSRHTGWFYEEHIWKNGRQEYYSTASCSVESSN